MFEGVYSVPNGVSFNSYLCLDTKTVLFDTVDATVAERFFENLAFGLSGRKLDYLVIQHMEPDHSATIAELLLRYPDVTIVCNEKIRVMIGNFFGQIPEKLMIVEEGDTLCTGMHTFKFVFAPMVHWPEVMVTYDETDKILFSADAFGTFGATNGAIFADEVDFERDYLDEARRYYINIVGKYGPQVQTLLSKATGLDIRMIAPLHGFVWRKNLGFYLDKYDKWSSYTPEINGVCIAYASIYGHTENAAEILAVKLRELGVPVDVFDTSVVPVSDIVAQCFRYSHIAFASSSYNAGMFVTMETLINDLAAHNFQNRTVAIIENGSWMPAAGKLLREKLSNCQNITIIDEFLSIRSSLTEADEAYIGKIAERLASDIPQPKLPEYKAGEIQNPALFKMTYGLYVLSAKNEEKDNACIINAAMMITDNPKQIAFTVNKQNYTESMLGEGKEFTLSVLNQDVPFEVIKRFGFQSGKDTDKFAGADFIKRAANGTYYTDKYSSSVIAGKITKTHDCGTHMMFIADITEAFVLSDISPVSYEYYGQHIKPKPSKAAAAKKGWVCTVCGYVYEGETLPPDFICPICKHGVDVFNKL
ncbi:MAG: flavin reductase [Ruminococcus sp.]|jgi:flavorubredoxin/flavin reductase (DIM6/NTAB) family NADH-FMN oxidoreductase RutF|nr:flavin reductase [Ruminococcus sp.]